MADLHVTYCSYMKGDSKRYSLKSMNNTKCLKTTSSEQGYDEEMNKNDLMSSKGTAICLFIC